MLPVQKQYVSFARWVYTADCGIWLRRRQRQNKACHHGRNRRAEKEWEGIHPVNVETDVYEDNVELPIGSWLVPLAQPLGNLVATLLEPESVCGFVNFCVIPAEEGKGLFVSRLIK